MPVGNAGLSNHEPPLQSGRAGGTQGSLGHSEIVPAQSRATHRLWSQTSEGRSRPATLAIDFSFIRTVATHAAAVHGIEVSAEEVRLARFAMKHLGLVGRSDERDRRPTQDELGELIEYFESNRRQSTCALRQHLYLKKRRISRCASQCAWVSTPLSS